MRFMPRNARIPGFFMCRERNFSDRLQGQNVQEEFSLKTQYFQEKFSTKTEERKMSDLFQKAAQNALYVLKCC